VTYLACFFEALLLLGQIVTFLTFTLKSPNGGTTIIPYVIIYGSLRARTQYLYDVQ
jgi:hypothetical protein